MVVFPQVLLCGLIWPREQMAAPLRAASDVTPLRYAVSAMTEVGTFPQPTTAMWEDLSVVLGFGIVTLTLCVPARPHRVGGPNHR